MLNVNTKTINRILYFTLLVFSFCLIFVVSKYIGLVNLLIKIMYSLIPVFIAVFVSFLFEPLIGIFLSKGIKRKYSVLLSYFFVFIFIIVLLYFTIPSLIAQVKIFITNIPSLLSMVSDFFYKIGYDLNKNNFLDSMKNILADSIKKLLGYITSSFTILFNIILGVSGAVFLSFDFPKFREGVKKFIPDRIKKPVIFYFQKFLPFVHKYFMGMLIDSILIFVISIIGFSLIDLDYILVVSLFIAITNLIPIIGPYIGGVPASIIGFSVSLTLGISAIFVVIIVQFIESNIVQPLILKNVIKLHPLEGILGISLFGTLFGVVGMILSPILIVAIKLLFIPYKENVLIKEIKNN